MKVLWGTMDMTRVPQMLFSKYTANLKIWFLNKSMANNSVNFGSIKCSYFITFPFDLEDCAHILLTVIDFAGLHVRINAT